MPPASVLNPLAASFHPRYDEPLDFGTIYTEGVPCAYFSGSVNPEHETLLNISDDALDEAFPPSADEAAEIDAVMDFVLTMSYLSLAEEQEERARADLSNVAGKRWEARRAEGMKGRKPHPARPRSDSGANDGGGLALTAKNHRPYSQETDIIPVDNTGGRRGHRALLPRHDMEIMRSRNLGLGAHGKLGGGARHSGGKGFTRPIQQPRKQHR